MSTRRYS